MKLIKLDAIDSTNEFLKGLSNDNIVENFTVVSVENQIKGKGQMGALWKSESGKNLTISILVKDFLLDINQIFNLNIAVSVAVIRALKELKTPELKIKWPNDIMSYNKKIGGILIENSIKSDGTIQSIVGLGLNVNQTNFEDLPNASSLAVICKTTFDKEEILFKIVENIKEAVQFWNQQSDFLWLEYMEALFRKGIATSFLDQNNENFIGIIQGVSAIGKLQVLLEDGMISEFDLKEIIMLY